MFSGLEEVVPRRLMEAKAKERKRKKTATLLQR